MEHQVKYSEEIVSGLRDKISSRPIKLLSKTQKDEIVFKQLNCIPEQNSRIFKGITKYPVHSKVKFTMPHIQ